MAIIRRLVLDSLKPHEPNIIDRDEWLTTMAVATGDVPASADEIAGAQKKLVGWGHADSRLPAGLDAGAAEGLRRPPKEKRKAKDSFKTVFIRQS